MPGDKSFGFGGNDKEMTQDDIYRFAEQPQASDLQGYSLKRQRELIEKALNEVAHNNRDTAGEILRLAYMGGVLEPREILTTLMKAIAKDVGGESSVVEALQPGYSSVEESKKDSAGAERIVRALQNAHNFLGNTLKALTGVTPEELRKYSLDGFSELKKNKKGIFGSNI